MYPSLLITHHKRVLSIIFALILLSIFLILLLYQLDRWPALWWDEGWTLDAARNWIEHGQLVHFLEGQPIPLRSTLRLPLILPVALSMRLLGVGIWQGRLPVVLFTILTLGLVFYLSSQIYNKKTGLITLFLMLCISPINIHPIMLGRQVISEIPMMFYLLAGYSMLWLAMTRSPGWGVGAILLFGIALNAKLQVPPFWLVSMIMALSISIRRHKEKLSYLLTGVAIGSFAVAGIIFFLQQRVMQGSFSDSTNLAILFKTIIFVPNSFVRLRALVNVLLLAFPQTMGFILIGKTIFTTSLTSNKPSSSAEINQFIVYKEIIQSALWVLGVSWLVWYALGGCFGIAIYFHHFLLGGYLLWDT